MSRKKMNFISIFNIFANTLLIFIIIISSFILPSCGNTRYLNVRDSQPSPEWGPREIQETVSSMTESIYLYLSINDPEAKLALLKFQNETTEQLDTEMISIPLQSNLLRKNIRFVNRLRREDALREYRFAKQGITSSDSKLALSIPRYVLEGNIRDNVRYVKQKKVQYILVSLSLTSLETTDIVWQDEKIFLKESSNPLIGL
jgi:PBP1b-binding outer membrane lipoprotein LpoB